MQLWVKEHLVGAVEREVGYVAAHNGMRSVMVSEKPSALLCRVLSDGAEQLFATTVRPAMTCDNLEAMLGSPQLHTSLSRWCPRFYGTDC